MSDLKNEEKITLMKLAIESETNGGRLTTDTPKFKAEDVIDTYKQMCEAIKNT